MVDVRTRGASHWVILISLVIVLIFFGAGFWSGTQHQLKRQAEANAERVILQDQSNRQAREDMNAAEQEKTEQLEQSKQVFDHAIKTDEAFKDWANVPLPCVARHLAAGRVREAGACGGKRRRT